MSTTAAAIRNACCATIEALAPRTLAGDRFELHREDQASGQTFEQWLGVQQSQVRRFIMRDTGDRSPPLTSNGDIIHDRVTFEVVVAYPISNRYGSDAGRSLEDMADEDKRQIDHAIGLHGSANVPAEAAFIVEASGWTRTRSESYVFLVGTMTYQFWEAAP